MPEARRFLRYVIPGLLSILEAFLFALFAWPDVAPETLLKVMKDLQAGGAFAAFFLTGALGYFLSAVHHTISWLPGIKRIYAGDYRPFFRKAFNHSLVTKEESNAQDAHKEVELSIEEASQAMAALWNESRECSKQVKAANDRVDSLTDLMHGAGAAVVGSTLAYIVFAFVAFGRSDAVWWRPTLAFAVLFFIHVWNYFKLREHATRVVEIVFWRELKRREKAPELLLWPKKPRWSKLMFWRKS